MHITDGIDMNPYRHKSDHDHHRHRQGIDQKTNFKIDAPTGQPGINGPGYNPAPPSNI